MKVILETKLEKGEGAGGDANLSSREEPNWESDSHPNLEGKYVCGDEHGVSDGWRLGLLFEWNSNGRPLDLACGVWGDTAPEAMRGGRWGYRGIPELRGTARQAEVEAYQVCAKRNYPQEKRKCESARAFGNSKENKRWVEIRFPRE